MKHPFVSTCLTFAACESVSVSSLLSPPLSEGGQSGWHSCRLDFLDTFLSRKKYRKKVRFLEDGSASESVGSIEVNTFAN